MSRGKALGDVNESWNALNGLLLKLHGLSTENFPLKKLLTNNGDNVLKYFKFLSGLKLPNCFAGCCTFEEFEDFMECVGGVPKKIFSTATSEYNGEHWFFAAFSPLIPTQDLWKVVLADTHGSLERLGEDHLRFKEFISGLEGKGFKIECESYEDDQDENECGYIAICSLCHCVFQRDWESKRLLGRPSDFVKFCNRLIGEQRDAALWLTEKNIIKIAYMLKFIEDNFNIKDWNQAHTISEIICKSQQLLDDIDSLQSSSTENYPLPDVKFPCEFGGCGTDCVIFNTGPRMKPATTAEDDSATGDEVSIRTVMTKAT